MNTNLLKILNNPVIFMRLAKVYPLSDSLLRNIRERKTKNPREATYTKVAEAYKIITKSDDDIENIKIWLGEPAQ